MSIKSMLDAVGAVGISAEKRLTVKEIEESVDDGDYEQLLTFLGEEDDGGWRSKNIWHFDTECIEDKGDYARLVKRFAELAGGALSISKVRDSVGERRVWVEFCLDNHIHKWSLTRDDDWVDKSFLQQVCTLLDSKGKGLRFTYHDLGGQDFLIGCATETLLGRINKVKGLHFEWLTDAIASWKDEDDESDEDENIAENESELGATTGIIDTKTGAIKLDSISQIFSPKTRRSELLQTSFAKRLEVFIKNEPWCSYRITKVKEASRDWVVVLFFNGEKLWRVQMAPLGATKSTDLKQLLLDVLGVSRTKHKWGTVEAFYDERSDCASVWIEYK